MAVQTFSIGLLWVSLLGIFGGQKTEAIQPVKPLLWQEALYFQLPPQPDPQAEAIAAGYLVDLVAAGSTTQRHGVAIASDLAQMAGHRQTQPMSAASLTKMATTLAALEVFGVDHRFVTRIGMVGEVDNEGVLQGDLVVVGGGDPLLVWEEAIAIGNALEGLGIRQVNGDLIVAGQFSMNFKSDPLVAGTLLRQGIDARLWSWVARRQYNRLPQGTPSPQVAISGRVRGVEEIAPTRWLLRLESLSLVQILKEMNVYSNNEMAEILARGVGGAAVVERLTLEATGVASSEIQLINGSGLGVENRISPRAACQMVKAIERRLPAPLTVADLFPVAGLDERGTISDRTLPAGLAVKTGTLWQVSALAGAIPTRENGLVCFAIINGGSQIGEFRDFQDRFLQQLTRDWAIAPLKTVSDPPYFGDPSRIQPL